MFYVDCKGVDMMERFKLLQMSVFYQLKIGKKEASWAKYYLHGGKCMEATLFLAHVGKNYR